MTACGYSSAGRCEVEDPAAESLAPESPAAPGSPAARADLTRADPDCVGPIALPHELAEAVRGLAAGHGTNEVVPFWVCATELARRWSRDERALRARVVCGGQEVVAGPAAGEAGPVDVTVLVSTSRECIYVERGNGSLTATNLLLWGSSFVHLLDSLVTAPDADVISSRNAVGAEDAAARCRAAS